jgi:hypothetical protein
MKKIRKIAARMVAENKGLTEAREAYERMGRLQYTLPSPLDKFDWIRPIIDTSPYDALRGVTRALSNLDEELSIHPITVSKVTKADDDSKASKEKANQWEKALQWQMGRTAKRRASFRSSVIWSAALYDEIVAQVIHLPTQFKAMGKKDNDPRVKAAMRFGDYAIRILDAKSAFIDYSDYMPERGLIVGVKTAQEIVDFWGDAASKIQVKIDKDSDYASELLIELDYVDYEARAVWVIEENADIADDEGIVFIPPQPWLKDTKGNPVPFLPLIAVAGGNDIDPMPEFRRRPLLFPVYMAEQWVNTNIMGTIEFSRAIATAASPDAVIKGPGAEDVEFDYGEPATKIVLNQFQEYEQIRKQGLDPAIMEAKDRLQAAIQRATVADILVTGQPMGGVEAFAAYQLQVQVAISSLGGQKDLGERFYDEAYGYMLLITHYTGGKIVGYGEDATKYEIDSEDIDPNAIYLNSELKPDVPADRVQRVTAAVQMAQQLKYSTKRILEQLGENDPEGAIKEWKIEQMDFAYLQGLLQKIQAEGSGELAQMQQLLEQLMGQMEQMQAPGGAVPQENLQGGIPGAGGQGFNPAVGGAPPAIASPEGNTREAQVGVNGQPIAEVP